MGTRWYKTRYLVRLSCYEFVVSNFFFLIRTIPSRFRPPFPLPHLQGQLVPRRCALRPRAGLHRASQSRFTVKEDAQARTRWCWSGARCAGALWCSQRSQSKEGDSRSGSCKAIKGARATWAWKATTRRRRPSMDGIMSVAVDRTCSVRGAAQRRRCTLPASATTVGSQIGKSRLLHIDMMSAQCREAAVCC